ncbi:carboxypeptidase regulatory-like domain-containing protein [Chitinophaga sp. CF418]|uniref:TonB-dependent receptor n=1 Tax=Chitinophaga sp. CF418 TaxID=1855287 RepID=UPI00090F4C34|nr:carboxypeptidase regulatory-like domain-containing protein [Chitinophaga sp. CF418]SHN32286.1 Outer membrane cobalamin receptor protein [Chitinophaga sp. CF418]
MKKATLQYYLPVLLLTLLCDIAAGQQKVSGTVKNDQGAVVPFASVSFNGVAQTQADSAGYFSLETKASGKRVLSVSAVGYKPFKKELVLTGVPLLLGIILQHDTRTLNEVSVSAGSFDASDKAKGAALTPIDAVTVAGSNADITQALRALPGAQQIGEQDGLFVRGGTNDETKQFVDGTLLKNPNYPAVPGIRQYARINPFLFKGILFSSGGYSALYGQAMSSALIMESVDLPEKSSARFNIFPANWGIGGQRLAKNNRSSYGININYSDQSFYNSIVRQTPDYFSGPRYLQGDANLRMKTGKTGMLKLYTNWSYSDVGMSNPDIDSNNLKDRFQLKGKNTYTNLSYRDFLSDNWKIDAGIAFSYNQDKTVNQLADAAGETQYLPDEPFRSKAFYRNINTYFAQARAVFTRMFYNNQAIRFGAEHFYANDKGVRNDTNLALTDQLTAVFAEGDIRLADNLAARIGARLEYSSLLDKMVIAPRASIAYRLKDGGQFNLAYGIFYQEPVSDLLYSNRNLDFTNATHYVLNYTRKKNNCFFRVEAYYKQYNKLVKTYPVFSNGGNGYAKGIELFWRDKRSVKDLDYWITYTYLDTKRNFLDYPYALKPAFAAPHTATIAIKKMFQAINTNVNVSYSVAAGRPYYDIRYSADGDGYKVFDQGKTRAYNVLNLHIAYLTRLFKKGKWQDFSGIGMGVTNLLGTRQVFGYRYSADDGNKVAVTLPATRGYYLGIFMSIGIDRTDDFLNEHL